MNERKQEKAKKINCLKCVYFRVTWNPAAPRACRLFGFKGKELPSVAVRRVTGKDCPSFKLKK
jgi:hypothetical protein